MGYVEYLRVRRILVIYVVIVASVVLMGVLGMQNAAVHSGHHNVGVSIGSDGPPKGAGETETVASLIGKAPIPLGLLLGIAGYCAVIFATILASSLNKENDGAHFAFTKPISRERLALTYMLVDGAGILAAFVFAFVVGGIVPLATFGVVSHVVVDAHGVWIGLLGLGIAFMWYGILQAVTASYMGRGGTIVGFSWVFFAILVGVPSLKVLGPAVVGLAYVFNFVNPIAYFSGLISSSDGRVTDQSILALAIQLRVALVWCIALVASGIAIASWKRVEV